MKLKISSLRLDGGTQPRARIDDEVVRDYANDMLAGGAFPDPVAFFDGTDYWLADGFHRVHAADQAGKTYAQVDVHQGTQRDAVLYACGANAVHGMRRLPADKRRAVMTLLRDPEWSKWVDTVIAKKTATTHPFVGELRKSLTCNVSSEKTAATDERYYKNKYGDISKMNVSNIGKSPRAENAAPEQEPAEIEEEETRAAVEEVVEAVMENMKQKVGTLDCPAAVEKAIESIHGKVYDWYRALQRGKEGRP